LTKLDQLPAGLPRPENDGACRHLQGLALPALQLAATDGRMIDLSRLAAARTIISIAIRVPEFRASRCPRAGT
jgi:hypothetical protein